MLWLGLLKEEAAILHHVPDMEDDANTRPKELVEAAVLHGGHPGVLKRPVLDVPGGAKKYVLSVIHIDIVVVVIVIVVVGIIIIVVAQDNKVITHLLLVWLHFFFGVIVIDGSLTAAAAALEEATRAEVELDMMSVVCCVMLFW